MLRRWGRLPYLKYTQNIKKHWFWLWWDRFRGVDYKAQASLVEDLYEKAFDSDGDCKVHTMCIHRHNMDSATKRHFRELMESL